MKTMLKAQFAKAFYLCVAFLLITTSFSANALRGNTLKAVPDDRYWSANGTHTHFDRPQVKLNRRGMLFVRKYIKTSSRCLVSVKSRSEVPFNIIDSVFTRYRLPVELKYLAVIESELITSATSHVGAKGPWQLMPGTAKILGLKVNRQCDERSNYYKSTIAAARYLRDLYALFDDWLLVLAAYNGGPKPVYHAISRSGSRNFWVLQGYLPAESREHVKKFIATHYYFEGRGSVTTLTKSENAAFKKRVAAYAKSLKAPVAFKTEISNAPQNNTAIAINQFPIYDMKRIIESADIKTQSRPNKQAFTGQYETPAEKFSRLMQESEAGLKNSRRIM